MTNLLQWDSLRKLEKISRRFKQYLRAISISHWRKPQHAGHDGIDAAMRRHKQENGSIKI